MALGTKVATLLAGMLVVAVLTVSSQATVILSDTFNNTKDSGSYASDYGVNQELATRQTGVIGTMTYTRYDGGAGNQATQVWNKGGWATGYTPIALDMFCYGQYGSPYVVGTYDFSSDMTISALLNPAAGGFEGTDPTEWVAMSTRLNTATPGSVNLTTQTGVTLKIQSNGVVALLVNGASVYSGSVAAANAYQASMTLQGNLLSVTITNPTTLVATTLDLNGALPGNTLQFTGGSATHNYIGFSCGTSLTGAHVSTVDDLVIQTPTVTLLPPAVAPTLSLTPSSTRINTTTAGGSTATVGFTTALTGGDQPVSGTVTYGDSSSEALNLPLPGANNHNYTLGAGVNSQTFNASVSGTNGGGTGNANAAGVTVLRAPSAVVKVNGVTVNDGDVLTIYGYNNVSITAADSQGFIESFQLTNGSTVLSNISTWSGDSYNLYGGTITFAASNTGSGANTSRIRFSVTPEPASLSLLALGALALLRRRK